MPSLRGAGTCSGAFEPGTSISWYAATRRPRAVQLLLLGLLVTVGLAAAPIGIEGLPSAEEEEGPEAGDDPSPEAPAEEPLDTTVPVDDWEQVADCESGDWDADGEPEPGSAEWDYGLTSDHGDHFEGGLNFHPRTWEEFREPDMPGHAGRASRREEIRVAERVLEEQGWEAWPVCSEKTDVAP